MFVYTHLSSGVWRYWYVVTGVLKTLIFLLVFTGLGKLVDELVSLEDMVLSTQNKQTKKQTNKQPVKHQNPTSIEKGYLKLGIDQN